MAVGALGGALAAWILAGVVAGAVARAAMPLEPDAELARAASWTMPTAATVRGRVLDWAAGVMPEGAARREAETRIAEIWGGEPGVATRPRPGDLLDAAFETVELLDRRAVAVRAAAADDGDLVAATAWLAEPATPGFERDLVSLWAGRELVRREWFDEALPLLEPLDVAEAIDPAALLFHRAACQHWLFQADAAIESLDRLLERESDLPARYARTATLLRGDAAGLEAGSLDHVARSMRDITRRLGQGRAGPVTRGVQEDVIAALDKLIKKLEDEQSGESAAAGAGGSAGEGGGRPLDDSRIAGGRGAGEATRRDLGGERAWGDLPPREREQALQQIGREFPPHYREAIEAYFKRLSAGREER